MSEIDGRHPDSARVERVPEGDAVIVFTACHGVRVFFPLDQARPEAVLRPVCRRCGQTLALELVSDDEAEHGLLPMWTEPEDRP
ncbi:MAG: hypothetical protein ACRDZO_19205 [Egibacteraceae bacterium]